MPLAISPLRVKPVRVRSVRNFLCVAVGVFTVHSCATTPPPSLTADDLLVAPYSYAAGAPFDVDGFLDALPTWLTTSYASANFDASRGAMVVDDLRIGFANTPSVGFRADRAVIWGANVGAMEAVFAGTANNAAKAELFERIMLEGVSSEGMQWEAGTESVAINVEKMVIDGLSARSYNLAPKAGVAKEAKFLRSMAAMMGAFAYDGAAYSNFSLRLANSQGEQVEVGVAEAFAREYNAGAMEFQSASGITAFVKGTGNNVPVEISELIKPDQSKSPYAKILNQPPSEALTQMLRHPTAMLAAATGATKTAYEIGYTEARGTDLTGALVWLARWELPPITETNLIDLGAQTMLDYREIWDGRPVQSIQRVEMPVADFYWLIPSRYDVRYSGLMYELSSMLDATQHRMGPGFSTETAPQLAQVREVMTALGIERIAGDSAFSWDWNGETGDASITTSTDLINLAANDVGIRVGGPNLAQWDAMARNDTPAMAALADLSLQGLNFGLRDSGLLDRAFAYAAQQQGGTGPEMRQSIAAMARLSGTQAASINPRMVSYVAAIADFLESGGRIDVVATPAEPVGFLQLQSVGQTAPETLPDLLDLTVTHSQ